jgi:hypothetical protein
VAVQVIRVLPLLVAQAEVAEIAVLLLQIQAVAVLL